MKNYSIYWEIKNIYKCVLMLVFQQKQTSDDKKNIDEARVAKLVGDACNLNCICGMKNIAVLSQKGNFNVIDIAF